MKTKTLTSLLTLLALSGSFTHAALLGTAFTYQGMLTDGGAPAQGIYDLRFTIYDTASGGNAVGGPITNSLVAVTNGLFTVTLDFGASVFGGQARWLEIAARTNGVGAFGTFPIRQPLTASPYAFYASSAGTATLADNVASNAVTASSIAGGQVVKSLNGLQDAITLAAGANLTLATNGNTLQISAGTNGSGGTVLAGYRENGPFAAAPLAAGNNAIAQGEGAQALGNNSVVGGGLNNLASQWFTTVGGGWSNIASGFLFGRTTISGGEWNQAQGDWSTVGGGQLNTAGGPLWGRATVAGGWQNQAGGDMSTIAGGSQNTALGGHGFIGGGQSNTITTIQAPWSAIGGGHLNQISGMAGTVGGGYQNTASATGGVVGGGENNAASGPDATVGGGNVNLASGYASLVGGGELNAATNAHTTVAGGNRNQAYGDTSTVGGGNVNLASGYASLVGGGELNAATNAHSTVAGGNRNKAYGDASTVSGGNVNLASGSMATVGGGAQNNAGGTSSTVPGGYNNRANGNYSFAAGQSAVASAQGSLVFADSQTGDFVSSLANEFAIRALNGVRVQSDVGIHLNAVNRPLIVRD